MAASRPRYRLRGDAKHTSQFQSAAVAAHDKFFAGTPTVTAWCWGLIAFASIATLTVTPVIAALVKGVKLLPGGPGFQDSSSFSDDAKKKLEQHYARLHGTLSFWKKQAEFYKRLHYYTVCWTIPSSVSIPFLVQAMTADPYAKWTITIVSLHTALLLAFHRALKVDSNYRAFRQGESEFYDMRRRLLDRPSTFGGDETEQLDSYFDTVENLRKHLRNAELHNFPSVDQAKSQLATERNVERNDN